MHSTDGSCRTMLGMLEIIQGFLCQGPLSSTHRRVNRGPAGMACVATTSKLGRFRGFARNKAAPVGTF